MKNDRVNEYNRDNSPVLGKETEMSYLKKTLAVLLFACVLFTMASCSSNKYDKAGASWANAAAKALPAEFNRNTCNKFWVGGDVYEFPMKAEVFFKNGWHIVDVYKEDVDENFLLDPHYEYELCLGKDGTGIMTWILNDSNEALPVTQCTVVYVKIDYYEKALLPGGALLDTRYKTLDEALAAFNKNMIAFDKEDHVYGYRFNDPKWGDNCSVRIDFSENPDDYSVGCVEYFALAPEDILN